MRRRPPVLLTGSALILSGMFLAASSTQFTAWSAGHPPPPAAPAVAAPAAPAPETNLDAVALKATAVAARSGADISLTVLDRQTGKMISSGDGAAFPIASVAKLFIADDLLLGSVQRKTPLSPQDRKGLDTMLRSSDDFPADDFWGRGGGNAVVARVAARYGLAQTTPPYDGNWWNSMSTTADLVRYYDKLLDGTGGLPTAQADMIVNDLAASTPQGVDGYPQRFGIPDGLFAEPVAVKQGWMCCWNGPNWLHMSTGVIGADHRYVIAIGSMQPVDDATARDTITDALRTMFPGGRI